MEVWDACQMNLGRWNPEAEHWFSSRLDDLYTGTGRVLTLSEWYETLRSPSQEAQDIEAVNSTFAEGILDVLCPRPRPRCPEGMRC